MLSDDINHIKMHREFAKIIVRKNENEIIENIRKNTDLFGIIFFPQH